MDGNDAPGTEKKPRPRARPTVTMAAVGRLAGVSQVTVSRALSDPSKVSPATLRKIRVAIEQTGFVPNAMAGALAGSRSRLVSVLVPSIANIVYSSMVKAFSDGIRAHGYELLLSETGFDPDEEAAIVEKSLSRRPDAIVLTGTRHAPRTRRMLLGAGIPVAEMWDITETPIDFCVGFSHTGAARAAADFALSRGYPRAANVSADDERALRRKDAFANRFSERTGSPVEEIVFEGTASIARGREGLRRLMEEHGFRSGVIHCSSDLLAHGVLIEAGARGLAVPGEIAVIGFGDQDFAAHIVPGITTVRIDRAALGLTAARAILDRLDGRDPAGAPIFDIGFEIVGRESA